MVPAFNDATLQLKVGEVSDPIETEFGYHVILRKEPVEELNAAHILIMHTESERAPETVKRSKAEALELALKVLAEARKPGADFAALAKKYSDGPSGPRGGDLGVFSPNRMVKPFTEGRGDWRPGRVTVRVPHHPAEGAAPKGQREAYSGAVQGLHACGRLNHPLEGRGPGENR